MTLSTRSFYIWTFFVWFVLTAIGLTIYLGSIHSGGISLYIAAVLVPPLFLDITGVLRIDNFALWLLAVSALQLILCGVLVGALFGIKLSMSSSHNSHRRN